MNKDINRELNSFRGFTLIELLAVIVVLAIIILIAVNAVLPQMDRARRNALAIEANSAIQSAQSYFTAGNLMGGDTLPVGEGSWKCISIEDLIKAGFYDADVDTYKGSVQVTRSGGLFLYKVWIHNDEYQIVGAGVDTTTNTNKDVALDDVKNYEGNWKDLYNNCDKASSSGGESTGN